MYLNRRLVSMSGLINLRDIFYFELHGSYMYAYYMHTWSMNVRDPHSTPKFKFI